MDFTNLLNKARTQKPTDPREIYAALPNKPSGYGHLRDVQGQILQTWFTRRAERDLVIKTNTGGGKTITALVVLQSYINNNEGPCLYVVPNKQLLQQVLAEAIKLGIRVTDNVETADYLNSDAIGVVTVDKVFNGRSIFSSQRPSRLPVPIGSIVIDDAHAALPIVRSAFTLDIPVKDSAYGELLSLFAEDLEKQSASDYLDVKSGAKGSLAVLPFWSWQDKLAAATDILHRAREERALFYHWGGVRQALPLCRVTFSEKSVSVAPVCPPIQFVDMFSNAKHRIYLTATLADDTILVTDFDAEPDSVSDAIFPRQAGDIGERMILAPQQINPSIITDDLREAIAEFASAHNVVVIVPSFPSAAAWEPFTKAIATKDDIAEHIDRLKSGHVGLVVFVNRYDGIDLPDDACRVLVLDGLPSFVDNDDLRQARLTDRLIGIDQRQVQRIEQGMGRAIRSVEDYCVVFLIGQHLTQVSIDPRLSKYFSVATRTQLELSRSIASELASPPLSKILDTARQALDRDEMWRQLERQQVAALAYEPASISKIGILRRRAFNAAYSGDHTSAVAHASEAVGAANSPKERGWLLEEKAMLRSLTNRQESQRILAEAMKANPSVARTISGFPPSKLSPSASQAKTSSAYLASVYASGEELALGIRDLINSLVFHPEQSERFEATLLELAQHIGLSAERPDRSTGTGPDGLWALSPTEYWVIEAKSESTIEYIRKSDLDQLSGHLNWFKEKYDGGQVGIPVMIHPSLQAASNGTPPKEMRVIEKRKLGELRNSLEQFGQFLSSENCFDDPLKVQDALTNSKLRASDLSRYLAAYKKKLSKS